jgi:hypothetical protein
MSGRTRRNVYRRTIIRCQMIGDRRMSDRRVIDPRVIYLRAIFLRAIFWSDKLCRETEFTIIGPVTSSRVAPLAAQLLSLS